MTHPRQKRFFFKSVFRAHSPTPSPFLRRRFRSQSRNDANVRREVPAAESPATRGTLDSGGAKETGEVNCQEKEGNWRPLCCPLALHRVAVTPVLYDVMCRAEDASRSAGEEEALLNL